MVDQAASGDEEREMLRALGIGVGVDLPSKRLYRYRAFNPIEIRLLLAAGQIRFANASFFNDPWDCRPRFVAPEVRNAEDVERIISEFVQRIISATPNLDPAEPERIAERIRRDPAELQRFYDNRSERVLPSIRSRYPVLCLSASPSEPRMWSHYADSHRGICLIFDTSGPVIGEAWQVQYADSFPLIRLADSPVQTLVKGLLTKSRHWEFESEYRVIAREYRAGDESQWKPASMEGFVDVSADALVGVILGALIDSKSEESARALIAAAGRPLEIWRARLQHDRWELNLERAD